MGVESEIPTFPADLDILCETLFFTKSLESNCQNVNCMFTHECFQPHACRSAPGVFSENYSNNKNVYAFSCVILKSFFSWHCSDW